MTFTGTDGKQYPLKRELTPNFWTEFYTRANDIINDPANRAEFRREFDSFRNWFRGWSDHLWAFHPDAQEVRKAIEEFKENTGTRFGNTLRFAGRNLTAGLSAVTGQEIISSKGSDVNKISKFQNKALTAAKPIIKAAASIGAGMIGINTSRGAGFGNMFAPADSGGGSGGGTANNTNIIMVVGGGLLLLWLLKKK